MAAVEPKASVHSVSLYPDPEESLISYMFRLSERRRMSSAWALAEQCGFNRFTNRPLVESLTALSRSARMDLGALEAISFGYSGVDDGVFRGRSLDTIILTKRKYPRRRVCPACLAEKPVHRAIWDLDFTSVCPVHLLVLPHACRTCGKDLKWGFGSLTHCRCNADLTKMEAPPVSEDEAAGTAAVHGLLGDERFDAEAGDIRSLEPFVGMEEGRIVEFIYRTGLEVLGQRPVAFSFASGIPPGSEHTALNEGVKTMRDWPEAFGVMIADMTSRTAEPWGGCEPIERWLATIPDEVGTAIRAVVAERRMLNSLRPNRKSKTKSQPTGGGGTQ